MLNFFKTKTFKVGSLVVAFAIALTLTASAATYMPIKTGGVENVKAIQTLVGAVADGKAGPKTMAAIATWQAANGLTADGKFGPASAAKANGGSVSTGGTVALCPNGMTLASNCATAPGTTGGSTGGTLAGMFGNISTITQLSQYSNEEVGGGQDGVKVMGFDVEASNDGDIKMTSLKLTFDNTGNSSGDSDRLSDYLDTVTVMMGSTKVGSSSADDFTKDSAGIYSKTIQLDNAVVKADQKVSFYVAVDAISNFDSEDINSDSMTVGLVNIRYMDGSGVTTTDSDTAPSAIEYNTAGDGVAISFVTYSSAADTELKFSTDNTPDAALVEVDSSENTDNVSMLKGKIEVEGDSDVWLDEMPFTVTATGDSPSATTGNVTLTIDGKTFTESVTTTGASSATITFDDLDLTLAAGKTVKFAVTADVNDIEDTGAASTDFDEADQLTVSFTTTNRASVVAENEQGDPLTDSTEMTGSATGNAMTFRTEGVNVVMGTPTLTETNDQNGNTTSVGYSIPVSVTAFGDTLYIGQSASLATGVAASKAFNVVLELDSAQDTENTSATTSITFTTSSGATVESNGFRLDEGETENFVVNVNVTAATDNKSIRVRLDQVQVYTGAGLESTATSIVNSLTPTTKYRTDFNYLYN